MIECKKWEKIYLISEDRKNPVVDILIKNYPNILYYINNDTNTKTYAGILSEQDILNRDISLVLGATNIASDVGTFVLSLALFSNNIKNIYNCNYKFNSNSDMNILTITLCRYPRFLSNKNLYYLDYDEYYNIIGKNKWENLIPQRELIIKYKKYNNDIILSSRGTMEIKQDT